MIPGAETSGCPEKLTQLAGREERGQRLAPLTGAYLPGDEIMPRVPARAWRANKRTVVRRFSRWKAKGPGRPSRSPPADIHGSVTAPRHAQSDATILPGPFTRSPLLGVWRERCRWPGSTWSLSCDGPRVCDRTQQRDIDCRGCAVRSATMAQDSANDVA